MTPSLLVPFFYKIRTFELHRRSFKHIPAPLQQFAFCSSRSSTSRLNSPFDATPKTLAFLVSEANFDSELPTVQLFSFLNSKFECGTCATILKIDKKGKEQRIMSYQGPLRIQEVFLRRSIKLNSCS